MVDNKAVAEFRQSIYKDGFGFDVIVFLETDQTVRVESNGLLSETYNNFEEFLDDLIKTNPLWFTYYLVKIDKRYKDLVKAKLKETIEKVYSWLDHSVFVTELNWDIGESAMADFIPNTIKETVKRSHHLGFLTNGQSQQEKK